jgi:glutamine amidotransferase
MLSGRCYRLGTVRLKPDTTIKVPHVGWNSLAITGEASILDGVANNAQVYFTHSYVAPITSETVAVTEHGEPFAAVVQRANIAGVQFHPEKSGDVGLQVLRNFLQLAG